jgi:hypothetical protein
MGHHGRIDRFLFRFGAIRQQPQSCLYSSRSLAFGNHAEIAGVLNCSSALDCGARSSPFKCVTMRWSIVLLCLAQAGCSLSDAIPETPPSAPDAAAFGRMVEQAAREGKLPPPIEVSPLRAADPISPAPWMACVKSSAPDQLRQYAVFMRNNDVIAIRLSVLIDRCDSENYQPFPKTP